MNVVNVTNLDNYYNTSFVQTQIKRYSPWFIQYSENGEVAFHDVLVQNDSGEWKYLLVKNRGIDDDGFSIITYAQLLGEDERGQRALSNLPIISAVHDEYFYVGIPREDPNWLYFGVHDMDDMPKEDAMWVRQQGVIGSLLFAKINIDAFKCHRKIIRLSNVERRPPEVKRGDPYDDSHYKSISLSPGFKYSYQAGLSMPRSFTRHCEAWGVRGHYRHYKNGKVVYIAPYQKGRGRLKQTTYKVKEDIA